MQKKYGKADFVAITLSMDNVREEKNPKERDLKKLKDRNANLINFFLDEDAKVAQEKLRYQGGLPMAYVFNRQGKWKLIDEGDVPKQVEETVQRFLKEK
jgi:hypothetical protein